ncbi:MAG: tetratricopeptide repeat protein, partial [Thermoflexia bacterium]
MLDKVVLALGLLEDDESLLRLYELHRGLLGECGHSTLHILAAAAANLRRWGIAQRIWRILDRRDWGEGLTLPSVMFPQSRAVNLRKPAPGRNSRYSTRMVVSLMSPRALREALEVISMVESKTFSRGQIRRRVQQIAKQNPLFFHHLEFLFLEDSEYDLWAELLLLLEKPEADELVFRVARGQQGTMTERLEILSLLAKHGRIPPDQTVEVWDETRGEWRTLRVPYWEIEPLPPETERIIVQVLSQTEDLVEQGKWKEVQREVEEALAAHPNMPELYFLLGEAYLNQGYQLKALGAYQRALELDPQSPLARCSIAILHLRENDTEAARRMLEPLGRVRMHPREYIHWLEAMALLHFLEHDYGLAQFYVNRALEEDPDNQILRQIQWMIEIQLGEGIQRYAQERKERVAQRRRRPILADASLAECLDRISRESLQATARAMPTPVSYGGVRKSELIQRLTRVLTDPYWLERIVRGLSAQEQDALWDVLKAGGVMAWELFTERYGDDLGESPDWEYHEPETVMGRLRMLGLLSDGTWEGQYVVLVPK